MSRGAHKLLREGASLVEAPGEVLAELFGSTPEHEEDSPIQGDVVLEELARADRTVDELSAATGIEARALLARLVLEELSGLVTRAPGGIYRLVRKRTRRRP